MLEIRLWPDVFTQVYKYECISRHSWRFHLSIKYKSLNPQYYLFFQTKNNKNEVPLPRFPLRWSCHSPDHLWRAKQLWLRRYISSLPLSHLTSNKTPGTYYSQTDINNAATAALSYYAEGETVGNDDYPHQYKDYEGFTFSCSAPYLEFPILSGSTYSGGSPGADRVVIGSISSDDSIAQYCAVITHDGESNNDFAECSDS